MTQSNAYNTGKIFDGYMGRNKIINGSCAVAQRAAAAFSTGLGGYGGPDRFQCGNGASAGGQFTQSVGSIVFGGVTKNAVVQTVNTAIASTTSSNYWNGFQQIIEGVNAYDLLGQPISVSFIFNTNVTGTYSLALRDNGSNSYVTTFTATANTPARYTFSIPTLSTSLSIPFSTGIGLIVSIGAINTGTFQTSGTNLWQSGNFLTASGSTNWGASINNFIAVTELQVEEGAIATPFERESYSITVTKCWRYFYSTSIPASTGQVLIAIGIFNSATSCVFSFSAPVNMRVAPTLTSANLFVTSATAQSAGTSTVLVGVTNTNQIGFEIVCSGATFTTGQAGGLYLGNGSLAGGFFLSAEF